MKTAKIICLIVSVTVIAVFYVWQQTQIVKLSYQRQDKLKLCRESIDQNMVLRYSLMELESLYNLTNRLAKFDTNYEIPHFSQVIDLRSINLKEKKVQISKLKYKGNMLLSLFGPRSQAEAQTE